MASKTLTALAGGLAVAALTAPAAFAEERTCRSTIGAKAVDNVRVPAGASCTLTGTYVKGTVKVERNAGLRTSGVRVIGNIQAENARSVIVRDDSRVRGSIQFKQGGAASVVDSRVGGDIQYDANTRALKASRNAVGGSIQVFQNTGGVTIASNRVNGNLQCKENKPAPVGGANVVQGNKEDQCRGL